MKHTMLAARLHGARDLRVESVAVPDVGPGSVRVAVRAVGVCGSDLHVYRCGTIGDTALSGPLILGHEFAGVVEAVGEGVGGLRLGQPVAVEPQQPCGSCDLCGRGHPNLCPHHRFTGVSPTDGALAGFITVPASTCFPLPASIDAQAGALLEPLGVALHAVDLSHLRPGDTAAVIGAGPIGLLCVRALLWAGAGGVYVDEPMEHRRAWAMRWGAVELGDEQVDVAVEAAWSSAEALHRACTALRPGGRLVIVGIAEDDRLELSHSLVRRKGLTLALCRRSKHTMPRALRLVASGQIDPAALVTHRFPLTQCREAFDTAEQAAARGAVKVMVELG